MARRIGQSEEAVLYATASSVRRFSFLSTRNEHLWKLASFITRLLTQLHSSGEAIFDRQDPRKIVGGGGFLASRRQIRNRDLFWPFLSYVTWRTRARIRGLFHTERWILLYRMGGGAEDLSGYTKIIPPPDRFWADPHVVRRDDSNYVYIEDASLATGHGHISVMRFTDHGDYEDPIAVIERPYLLSYPFVFDWRGEFYMVPESFQNKTIEVYRCTAFPDQWELHCTLMEGVFAADTTLVEEDGLWWLFTNIGENDGASEWDELYLFYANSPLSRNWTPHPNNPVISDVRCARPAGRIFRKAGHLYRPSQDCSRRYGYGLNISRIKELNKTTYREEMVKKLRPGWDASIRGIHHISYHEGLTFIDGIHRARNRR